jgi:hypothetical protein
MFDAGFKWIRIGQYENSSDYTSWDWIEQKRGVYAASPLLEDAVDSLVDNGVNIQVQVMYGNNMYTSPSGRLPEISTPAAGSFHNDDRSLYSIFWPPATPEQIGTFMIAFTTGRCGTSRTSVTGIPGAILSNTDVY